MKEDQMRKSLALGAAALLLAVTPALAANWPAPTPGPIPGAGAGYVQIPDAAVKRDPSHAYKALFQANKKADDNTKPNAVLVRMAALHNALTLGGVPQGNIQFAAIFFGPGADALLTDQAYRAKHGVANPNLTLIGHLVKGGVKLYVCGQYMAASDTPRSALIPEAQVAESATLVMIRHANDGYAFLPN
jgi:intracellular sulfur oxidation DsrE/DsrF family protein